ncbi:hypothetical protein BsWGS_27874 [Bradybaena similaris]
MPLPFFSLKTLKGLVSEDATEVNASLSAELLGIDLTEGSGRDKNEVDLISKRLAELQEELLTSLKEDLSEWIVKTLAPEEVDINASNFIQALDTGIILCKLSAIIDKKAQESMLQATDNETTAPPQASCKLHCDETATSGTWYARDNTANFLKWCRTYGMTDEMLFDTEDLVTHHHERQVIYCLMELARMATRFGLEPPSLISMESEIDNQASSTTSQASDITLAEEDEEVSGAQPAAAAADPAKLCAVEGPNKALPPSKRLQDSLLDMEVYRVILKCQCEDHVNKLSEGVFDVYGKRVFIRLLQGKHLMVRVGGGWDTFENYLLHHKPVQVWRFSHASGSNCVCTESKPRPGNTEYLVIRSKYQSNSFCS